MHPDATANRAPGRPQVLFDPAKEQFDLPRSVAAPVLLLEFLRKHPERFRNGIEPEFGRLAYVIFRFLRGP
jgi:hypothetical protein